MSNAVIGALHVKLGLDSASFTRGIQNSQGQMERFGRRMRVVGAAISAVGTGVALAIRGQINAAGEIGRMAAIANTNVEQFQRMAAATATVGIQADQLSDILKDMGDRVGDFLQTGGGPMADFFENIAPQVGVTAEQFRNLSGADALQLYVSSLERANLSQSEMTFYMEAIASNSTALLPLLAANGAEMNRLGEAAASVGGIMSAETVEGARRFQEQFALLQTALNGITQQIMASLLPAMNSIAEFATNLAARFGDLDPTVQRFAAAIAGLSVVVGPLLIVAGTLVTVLAGLSAPVLAAVAAVAALTAGVIALWPHFVGLKDAAVDLVTTGLTALVEGFNNLRGAMEIATGFVVDSVIARFEQLVAYFAALPARFLEFGRNIIQGLADGVLEAWDSVRESVTGVFDGVLDYLPEWAQIRSPSRLFHGFGEFIMEGLANGLMARAAEPVAALQGMADQMTGPIQNAASQISGAFENAFVGFVSGTTSARDALSGLASDLARMAAQSAFRQLFGGGGASGGGGLGGFFSRLFSFDGGGFTGNAPRAGGLDGKGGFLAMMHPQETVIDHTRGQAAPAGAMSVSIGFDNSAGGLTAMMRDEAGRVVASARSGIVRDAVGATYKAATEVPFR